MTQDALPRRRLYGRSKGKVLRPHQSALIADLLPQLALDLTAPLAPREGHELRVEIGFGGGEHMAAQAGRNPETLVIGAEPFVNGVASAVRHVEEQALSNVLCRCGAHTRMMKAIKRYQREGVRA